jgi:prevent-host-death family protein
MLETRRSQVAKRYSAQEARQNLADILGMVYYGKEPVIVEKRGKMVAAVISPEDYALLQQQKERAFAVVDRIQARNAAYDPDEVLADVMQAVEEVRRQRHEQRLKAA